MESKKKIPDYIHPAGYGKSTLGFILDAVFTVAMIFVIYFAFGRPVLLKAQDYDGKYEAYTSFVKDSHLTQGDSSGTFLSYSAPIEDGKAGYQKYQEAITYYYVNFIPSNQNAIFLEEDGVSKNSDGSYSVESISKFVLKKVYKLNEDGTQIEANADPYFVLNAETEDPYDVTLSEEYSGTLDSLKLTSLLEYFAGEGNKGVYYDAITHFSSQPYFTSLQSELGYIRYMSFIPSFVISPLIFFFLIPVFVPNGRSLGKLIAKTAVLSRDGYKARKLNIILHYACLTLVWECLLIPNTAIGIMAMMLILLIDYMALVLSKSHQSLHDKIAQTLVVNSKDSVWFADEDTALEYVAMYPDSPVASFYKAQGKVESPNDYYDQVYLREQSIVDSSTIGKAREEAKTIDSFDEFESRGDADKK